MKDFTTTTNSEDKTVYKVSSIKNIMDKNKFITINNDVIKKEKNKNSDEKIEKDSSLGSLSRGCGCLMISLALVFLFAYQSVFNFIIQLISIIKA